MEGHSSTGTMLPPGFRFHPTDEELVTCYLISKISNPGSTGMATLVDVDLNRCEPWDLPGKAKIGENEWYFFSHRDRKYPTGSRTNRATKIGYWKTTGKDKEIFSSITSKLIGMKKTLVFYRGRAPRGEKTDWVMHEFRLYSKPTFPSTKMQEEWVICRVFQKSGGAKKYQSNCNLEIRPFMEKLEPPALGSSSYGGCGPNMNTGREALIPALKLPQIIPSSDVASCIYAGSRFDGEMGYAGEQDGADSVQRSGYSGFESSVDLHTYWSSFC